MKRILITGANSYIGTSFENYVKQWPNKYQVDTIDMVDGTWREKSFVGYDVIFHVAGIAHADTGKVNEERKALYYKINTDLAVEAAKKAKTEGVKQFIFMSSIIIYGESAPVGEQKIITQDTIPQPANFYGDSKLQAEKSILLLQDYSFNVVILRPPMIYGKGSKGNYPKLAKYAVKLLIFPDIDNCRSMLYIKNFCEFVRLMIQYHENGIFFPQNAEYVSTSEMVKVIAAIHGKKVRMTKLFNPIIKWIFGIDLVKKVFGNLVYEKSMSDYRENYRIKTFKKSIELTELESGNNGK